MTKEECIALLERYAEYDGMGIPNLAGCREAMRMAAVLLSQPSLPSSLDEAAIQAHIRLEDGEGLSFLNIFKAGAEWMAGQDRKIWNSSIRSVPEGNKSQILSFDAEGYFYLNRKPHPNSLEWCFAKELLPIRKIQ